MIPTNAIQHLNLAISAGTTFSILFVVGIVILFVSIKNRHYTKALTAWASGVPISPKQLAAMKILLDAYNMGKVPTNNPLLSLSPEDLNHISAICRADYRPAYFGNSNAGRIGTYLDCQTIGFDENQSLIIAGIIFNAYYKRY